MALPNENSIPFAFSHTPTLYQEVEMLSLSKFRRTVNALFIIIASLSGASERLHAQATIPLVNPSFEQPALAGGQYYWYLYEPNAPGWISRNPSDGGIINMSGFFPSIPDGVNVALVNNWGLRFNQQVSTVVEAGKTYTAKIWVGNPDPGYARSGQFELWAGAQFGSTPDDIVGGTRLAYKIARTAAWGPGTGEALIPDNGFTQLTLSYTAQVGSPAIGQPLMLSFFTIGGSAGPTFWDKAELTQSGGGNSTDLGVRYISRSPLYYRYNVGYLDGIPYLASTHNNLPPAQDKHWPDPGERVTFTAHIRNNGGATLSNFAYRWYLDDVPVTANPQTYTGTVLSNAEVLVSMDWNWPANLNDHRVKIVVDPNNAVNDPYRQNNTYTDHTNALSFSIWVEQGLFDRFNQQQNGFGTYSFDDWFRWQFEMMKTNFARSIYPNFAPNGILERIRVEEINVVPFDPNNLNNWRNVMNADPHLYLNDGRWQFTSEASTLAQKQADWDNYLVYALNAIDWGLIHELSHQLGVIDEYRMNIDDANNNQVLMRDGRPLKTRHNFHLGGLMGGGYVLPQYDGSYYDSHTAGFLNRNLHFRRGYYGEFLFDTPATTTIQVSDIFGQPLPYAMVSFYQKNPNSELLLNTPVFSVKTGANGTAVLPNMGTPTSTTATGHTLHPNPFGRINVVGTNGVMLVKISYGGQEDFRWFEIIQLNEAFWRGETGSTVVPFSAAIIPGINPFLPSRDNAAIGRINLALRRPATASSNSSLARNANNGDKTDPTRTWYPDFTGAGQWWQVDLGRSTKIARAVVYPYAGNPHDWYHSFHFEASKTGAFQGEQITIPAETAQDTTRNDGDYLLQRLTGFTDRMQYTFPPVNARYFRIVSDVEQSWVQLQELEVYELESRR